MSEQEMIARIIDPDAFKNRETLANYCIGQGDSAEVAHEYAEQTHRPDCATALAKAAAILTTLASRTPEGMVMVPREPTPDMLDAGVEVLSNTQPDEWVPPSRVWAAMLSATPTPSGAE